MWPIASLDSASDTSSFIADRYELRLMPPTARPGLPEAPTARLIAANRRNVRKSTGPCSASGCSGFHSNGFRRGFSALALFASNHWRAP
jgi:hypothetical protein